MENYSLSDLAAVTGNEGFGNGGAWWIIILFLFAFMGNGWNNNGFGNYATAASQQEILFGQQFQNLDNKIDRIGNGIADATFALNNSIKDGNAAVAGRVVDEGRNIQTQLCAINSNIDNKFAALEKSQLEQRIQEQQAQITQLQMAQQICGIPKMTAVYPYNACGCGCGYAN